MCDKSIDVDESIDGSLKAQALSLPGEVWLGQQMNIVDVDAIHAARSFTRVELAKQLNDDLHSVYERMVAKDGYRNDKTSIDQRRLKNAALSYLTATASEESIRLASAQFANADNMTDAQAALSCLVDIDCDARSESLQQFYDRFYNPFILIESVEFDISLKSRC